MPTVGGVDPSLASGSKHIAIRQKKSFATTVGIGVSHCGAGCTLEDIIGGWIVSLTSLNQWNGVVGGVHRGLHPHLSAWHHVPIFFYHADEKSIFRKCIVAALKADALSLTSFKVGLFGWMALMQLVFFPVEHLHPDEGPTGS